MQPEPGDPEGPPIRASALIGRAVRATEEAVHVVVALLLALLCVVLVVDTVRHVAEVLTGPPEPDLTMIVLALLEQTLLLFIVAELLHTVAIAVEHHGALDPVPFLVVALVAAIRSVLILAAEAERSFRWNPEGIELLILMALILVLAITAVVWRHSIRVVEQPPAAPSPENGGRFG
jgi:uncharacterized membrane protein (DUF373 family)